MNKYIDIITLSTSQFDYFKGIKAGTLTLINIKPILLKINTTTLLTIWVNACTVTPALLLTENRCGSPLDENEYKTL